MRNRLKIDKHKNRTTNILKYNPIKNEKEW